MRYNIGCVCKKFEESGWIENVNVKKEEEKGIMK
jgi:hypothetical protein